MCLSLAHPGSILLDLRWWQCNVGTLADLSAAPYMRAGMSQPQTPALPLLSVMLKFGFWSLTRLATRADATSTGGKSRGGDVRVGCVAFWSGVRAHAHNSCTCTHNHTPQGVSLCVCVTQCDKDKAQTFSQQGLRSLFVLLQIFVTPRKWPLPLPSQLSVVSGPAVV